jgi:phospholipid/cholesterol/gamma-HCH transport system substrate-binding protein
MKRSSFITWDQLKVGGLILVAMVVMLLSVYKLGQAANLWSSRYRLVTFLPNASGLLVGGQVTIAGQLAGTIKDIELLPVDYDTTKNLRIEMSVDRDLQAQIRSDSYAHVRTMGLLGDKVLDINPGSPRYSVLRDGDTLRAFPALDYEAVLQQAAGAVGDVVSLSHDLKALTGGIVAGEGTLGQMVTNRSLYDQLTSTLSRTNAMLERFQNPNGTMGRLLDDPKLYDHLTAAIASTDSLLVALSDRKGTLGRMLHEDSLYTQLLGMTKNADSLMATLTKGNGFAARMLNDQQLYDNMNKLVSDLSAIIADVRKDPRRYTKGMVKVF